MMQTAKSTAMPAPFSNLFLPTIGGAGKTKAGQLLSIQTLEALRRRILPPGLLRDREVF